MKGRKNSVMTS